MTDESGCRLLTLVGPGGIGKTRLAIEVASSLQEKFSDGVYFVGLASVSESVFIVSAIADTLGLTFSGITDPTRQLLSYLQRHQLLIVLDNFEHLLDGANLLSEIVTSAPNVQLLVTSRERLNLQEEWNFTLQGMDFPSRALQPDDEFESYTAIQLFIRRAQRAETTFKLTQDDVPHIVRVCQLVEGMPLGIELAAAWVRLLSCREIAEEIEQSLDFLTTSLQNIPERHRSIWAVFEQTWQRLSVNDQDVLQRLAIFRGGCTRKAAVQIAGATLPQLSALIERALLRRSRNGRYGMHTLLQQYVTEAQSYVDASHDEAKHSSNQLRKAYCNYYLALVGEMAQDLRGQTPQETVATLRLDLDNIRQAWGWASADGLWSALLRGVNGLSIFYEISGLFQEGETRFAQTADSLKLEQPELSPIRCRLRIEQARMLFAQGLLGQAAQVATETVELANSLTSLESTHKVVVSPTRFSSENAASSQNFLDKHLVATPQEKSMIAEWEQLNGVELEALARFELGRSLHKQGEHVTAPVEYERALTLARATQNRHLEADILRYWCWNCYDQGEFDRATDLQSAAEALYRQLGDRLGLGITQFDRAFIGVVHFSWIDRFTLLETERTFIFSDFAGSQRENGLI